MEMRESLFFMDLPNLGKLCEVKIILNPGILNSNIRDIQIKLCRHLLSLYDHIVASPVQEHFDQILIIMPISFYRTGKIQSIVEKHAAKMQTPNRVTSVTLQTCLSYALIARLAPRWNKAGHLLIQGEDFLEKAGKQHAVEMNINVSDTQICFSLQVHTIQFPPCELWDFNVTSGQLQSFLTRKNSVIPRHSILNNWCYILPSMKMGQIINISYDIPPESPFTSYKDFQDYWNVMYGYELPKVSEKDVIYCSVYFRLIGEKHFTYPFICVRRHPFQFYPQLDLSRVLNTFVSDLKSKMSHLCGFPVSMTNNPVYPTVELSRLQSQTENLNFVNLTTEMHGGCSYQILQPAKNVDPCQKMHVKEQQSDLLYGNLDFTNHPQSSFYIEPVTSLIPQFGSQKAHSSVPDIEKGKRYMPVFYKKSVTNVKYNLTNAAGYTKAIIPLTLKKKVDIKLKHTQSFNTFNFQNKPNRPSFINILDAKGKTATSSTVYKHQNIKHNSDTFSTITQVSCTSTLANKSFSTTLYPSYGNCGPDSSTKHAKTSQFQKNRNEELKCAKEFPAFPSHKKMTHENNTGTDDKLSKNITSCSILQEEYLQLKPKKRRTNQDIKEDDVERYAKNNQLFKLTNSTLQNWLKQHGISTKTRDKKEQLITKIMQFIHES